MQKELKWAITFASVAAFMLCMLPIMSVSIEYGERATLIVRGYNLIEFSAWGCIPVFAALLVPAIMFSGHTKTAKGTELLILSVGDMVSYIHSFNIAKAWLASAGGSYISYYPGALLYPISILGILICAYLFRMILPIYRREKPNWRCLPDEDCL